MTCEADIDKLVVMFKRLRLEEDKIDSSDKILEPIDIDKTGYANTCKATNVDHEAYICMTGSNILTLYYRYDDQSSSSLIERSPNRCSDSQFNEKAVSRHLAQVTSLSKRLIGQNLIGTFANNYEKTIPDWIALLRETSLPNSITSEDPCIITAFKVVDTVICSQGTALLQCLANV